MLSKAMFDPSSSGLSALQAFLHIEYEEPQNAAILLGGHHALRRVQRLQEDLSDLQGLTRSMQNDVHTLHDLFMLRNVHEAHSLEVACFAELDPASEDVHELCRLCDGLTDCTRALGLVDGSLDDENLRIAE